MLARRCDYTCRAFFFPLYLLLIDVFGQLVSVMHVVIWVAAAYRMVLLFPCCNVLIFWFWCISNLALVTLSLTPAILINNDVVDGDDDY